MANALLNTLILFLITCLILFTTRIVSILPRYRGPPKPRKRGQRTHLLAVLGSGGHTAEMLTMLNGLDTTSYQHRTYIISEGDPISETKATTFEDSLCDSIMKPLQTDFIRPSKAAKDLAMQHYGSFTISKVPRARKIHQSLLTTPFSCLQTFIAALRVLGDQRLPAPDLILTNGPATSAIVIFASLALRFIGSANHEDTRIMYVESFARVTKLSLSAKCVAWAVDRLLVQWEELHGKARGKAEYAGLLALASLPTT
jgi:beta-1,4-N-acetylglucosaminyltransferase